jgi:hypothetical protein
MKLGQKDLLFWHDVYIRKATEKQVIHEYYNPDAKHDKAPMSARELKKRIEQKLSEYKPVSDE